MATKKKYKSDAMEAIHQSAMGLLRVGVIDKTTMRQYDAACIAAPGDLAAADIKRIRIRNKVSQPVFAKHLNTSESTIQKWESGAKKPSGMALKLLGIVEKHGLEMLA